MYPCVSLLVLCVFGCVLRCHYVLVVSLVSSCVVIGLLNITSSLLVVLFDYTTLLTTHFDLEFRLVSAYIP
jgi:hypothetical protein